MRMTMLMMLAIVAAGCVETITEKGPTIEVVLDPTKGSTVSSSQSMPTIAIDTAIMGYSLAAGVRTSSGTYDSKTKFESVHVTSVAGAMSVGGMDIPFGTFTPDVPDAYSPTFERTEPVMLPASAMGQTLVVHMQATDENGVRSNVVDMNVTLN